MNSRIAIKRNSSLVRLGVSMGLFFTFLLSMAWAADDQSEIAKRLVASAKVLDEVMATPDKAIPEGVIKRATCVAVFPSMVQVAALVGAKHGKGFATCRTGNGWSAPAPLDVSGGSWGAQLGGESVDLVMVVLNEKGMQQLMSGKFNMGTETSVAAGPVGSHHWQMNVDMVTYSRARGVFAGTNLNGGSITPDEDDMRTLFGNSLSLADILTGKAQDPNSSDPFVATVERHAGQMRAKN